MIVVVVHVAVRLLELYNNSAKYSICRAAAVCNSLVCQR